MATTKQFGLSGIGSDVQLGKAGGRLVFSGGEFNITGSDGATLANASVAEPTLGSHVATKTYVDSVSAGLDPKESVRVATTEAITLSNTQTIDGIAVIAGDRVLVKDQANPYENGIYSVVDGGAWTRAEDMDGSPASEVSGGNFTFVEQGADNINTGWVVQGDGQIPLGTTSPTNDIVWVQFSGAGSITAGTGLKKTGETLSVDLFDADPNPIAAFAGTVAGATDVLLFGDADGAGDKTMTITVDKLFNDMDVVKGITANGFITRTGEDTYASREIAVDGAGALEGLSIVDGAGASQNPTLGLDINGNTARSSALLGTDSFLAYNGTATANEKFTFTEMLNDLDIVNGLGGNGIAVQTGADTYTARSVAASSAIGLLGMNVVNGDGVAGDITVGLDINGLAATTLELTDTLAVYSTSNLTNEKATIQSIVDIVAANSSDNEISQGDSSIVIADVGTGTITTTVDGGAVITTTASGTTINSLAVGDLTAGRVVFVGAGGELVDDEFLVYTPGAGGTAELEVDGGFIASTFVEASQLISSTLTTGRVTFVGADSDIVDSADMTFNGTTFALGGSVGLQVAGNATVGGSLTATSGLIDSTLTINNAVTYSDASGNLTESANFTFDGSTLTLTGDQDITGSLDIDNINIDGNTISSSNTDGDIILAPNGTGEVIIGNSGSPAQLIAEDDQSLTVAGGAGVATAGGDLNLYGGDGAGAIAGGDVNIQAGDSGTGTEGTIKLIDANDNLVGEIVNSPALTDGHLDFSAGSTIQTNGTAANIDLTLDPKGTGTVVVGDAATYDANVVAASLVTKAYVDAEVAANVTPGSLGSVSATVDYTSATVQAIGTIPANATVIEVKVLNGTASDAATTLTVGDATNGAASYMADSENDAEATGIFVADAFTVNGGADVTANATVATAGSVGSATVIITYRNA